MTYVEWIRGHVVLNTDAGEQRHPVTVLVRGQHVSVAEGVTLPPVTTRTLIRGFRIEMPIADWVRITEANHPGLRLTATGAETVTVIQNDQVIVLREGDSDGYHDLLIEPYEIDCWHLGGLSMLSFFPDQSGETPEWKEPYRAWLAHPTDPADVERAWATPCLRCDQPCEPGYDLCPQCVTSELEHDAEQVAQDQAEEAQRRAAEASWARHFDTNPARYTQP